MQSNSKYYKILAYHSAEFETSYNFYLVQVVKRQQKDEQRQRLINLFDRFNFYDKIQLNYYIDIIYILL